MISALNGVKRSKTIDNRKVVAWDDAATLRSAAEVDKSLKEESQPLHIGGIRGSNGTRHDDDLDGEYAVGFGLSPIGKAHADVSSRDFMASSLKQSVAFTKLSFGIQDQGDSLARRRRKQGNHRRVFRMFVISLYFLSVIVLFIYCTTRVAGKSADDVIQVDLNEDLYFEIQNCMLHIHVDHEDCGRYDPVSHPHCREGESLLSTDTAYVWHTAYLPMKVVGDSFSFTHSRNLYTVNATAVNEFLRSGASGIPDESIQRYRHEFKLKNEGSIVEMKACQVQLHLLHESQLRNLNIKCVNDCIINTAVHNGDGDPFHNERWTPVWSVLEGITVMAEDCTEDKSGILLASVFVGQAVIIDINIGDVYLEDFEISPRSQYSSYIGVHEGDLYGQVRGSLKVIWTGSTAFYCMSGSAHLNAIGNSTTCPAWVEGATDAGRNTTALYMNDECVGAVTFCPPGGKLENSTHCRFERKKPGNPPGAQTIKSFAFVPEMYLQVPAGSYYMSQRDGKGQKLPFVHAGAGFNVTDEFGRKAVTFDEASEMVFENAKEILGEKSSSDRAFVFQGPSSAVRLMRPSNAFVFAAMASKTYGELKPWWMSFLSLSMLVHTIETNNIRFRAGPCPYRVDTEMERIGDIARVIQKQATADNDEVENALFYILNEAVIPGQAGNRPLEHEYITLDWLIFKDHGEFWWRSDVFDDGTYEFMKSTLSSNPTLVAACIISAIVSLISASLGVYLAWGTVSAITWHFGRAGSHIKRYDQMFQQSMHIDGHAHQDEDGEANAAHYIGQFRKVQPQEDDVKQDHDVANRIVTLQQMDSDFTFSHTATDQNPAPLNNGLVETNGITNGTKKKAVESHHRSRRKRRSCACCCAWPGKLWHCMCGVGSEMKDLDPERQHQLNASGILGGRVKLISPMKLPSMFCYVDHFATLARKRWFDSLADFLQLTDPETGLEVVREVTDSSEVSSVSHKEFKDVYTQFCFLLDRQERNLHTDKAKSTFERHGLKSVQVSPSEQPFAFTKIRFKTQRERDAIMHLPESQAQQATETSLDFFLRVECQRTAFDTEQIILDEFTSRYKAFCENRRILDQVAVSKATMAEKGINSMKVEEYLLVPTDGGKSGVSKVVHLDAAQNHLRKIVRSRHGTLQQANERLWWLQDLCVVTAHFLIVSFMAVPLNLPAFWLSAVYGNFSTRDDKLIFTWGDLSNEPYLVMFKAFHAFPLLFFLFTIPGCFQWIFGFIELLSHYYWQEFPLDTLKAFEKVEQLMRMRMSCCEAMRTGFCGRKLMHIVQWVFFFMFVAILSGGMAMVIVWMILGALINPQSFLAYATGALTVVSFFAAKYAQCKQAFFKGWESVVGSLETMMVNAMNETLRTIMNTDTLGDLAGVVPGGQLLKTHVDVLAGSSLGKNIMSAGFDVEELVHIAAGSKDALAAFAEKQGCPIEVLQIMFAFTEGSQEKVVGAIGDLLKRFQDKSPVPAELATALAELAFRPSSQKTQKCVDMLFQHGVTQIVNTYLQERIHLKQAGTKIPSPISIEITLSDEEGARAAQFLEKMGPSGVKLELLSIVRELAAKQIIEEKKQPSSSIHILSEKISEKVKTAWETLRSRVIEMNAEQLGIHEQVFSTMHNAVLAEIKALTRDPVAKEALASLIKAEVAHQVAEKTKTIANELVGLTKQNIGIVQGHLQNLLPPLLRGFVAMFAEQDFQKFVESLRFVHQLVTTQKQLFGSIFGKDVLQNFENIAPLFHVLDLVLQTHQIPDAILGLLEEKLILKMPKDARILLDMILWMRDSSKKHSITQKEPNLLTSHRIRNTLLKKAVKAFDLDDDFLIILELLTSFALQDWRFFTFDTNAKQVTQCVSMLSDNRISPTSVTMMEQCFELALVMLASTQVTIGPQMFEDCQKRVGLDNASRDDIINLFITKEVSPVKPPKLEKSRLLEAAAEHVGLSMSEIVGLAHLLLGYTGTPKVAGLIRELLYRQNVMQLGVDKFITSVLAIVFRKSDQAVIHGLDHLRLQHRFLSTVGLGMVKPGYISDIMFARAGIKFTDVLEKRYKVAFSIEEESEDREVWSEWLLKAEMAIKEIPTHTSWKHPELAEGDDRDSISNTDILLHHRESIPGNSASLTISPASTNNQTSTTSMFRNKLKNREKKERQAERIRKAKVLLRKKRLKEATTRAEAEAAAESVNATTIWTSEHSKAAENAQSSSSEDLIGDSDSDKDVEEHLDLFKRADILQLRWLQGALTENSVSTLVDMFNHRDSNTKSDGFRLFDDEERGETKQTLLEKILAKAFNPDAKPSDFNECQSMRLLLQLQDLSTGKQKSLDCLRKNDAQMKTILKILKLEHVLGHNSHLREDAVAGLRKEVIKNYAELLRLNDTRALNDLFDLVAPLETKKAKDAIGVFGKLFMPTRVAEAAQTMTYWVLRQSKIFSAVRHHLWELAWHFHLPRFLGPATLMPSISLPPSLKEIGSLFHFLVASQLRDKTVSKRLQMLVFHLMRVHSTLPPPQDLMDELGIPKTPQVERIITVLAQPSPSVKIQLLPGILRSFYDVFEKDERLKGLKKLSRRALPYIFFFAGFPFTELGGEDGSTQTSALTKIAKATGIRVEILQAIDISQRPISTMSDSDETRFERESVLGLLAPLIESERIAQPHRSKELPTSSLVHSLCSLAYRKTAELEFLAESIQPIAMNAFVLQLLVIFVDLSNHARKPRYVETIMRRLRVNNDCAQALSDLGQNPQKMLALLEMSYPRLDDKASVAQRIERLGLADKVSLRIVELSYVISTCIIAHLEGVDELIQHERASNIVAEALRPLHSNLGFGSEIVPLLAMRLFHGDFRILLQNGFSSHDGLALQNLLPYALERDFAAGICGVLSHRPFEFTYDPVVAMGALTLKLRNKEVRKAFAKVRADTKLASTPKFSFRIICKKRQEDMVGAKVSLTNFDEKTNTFSISIDYEEVMLDLDETFVDVWWQSWPSIYDDPADLQAAQEKEAKSALQRLERQCKSMTVSSNGVCCLWWTVLGIHPLFYLMANRNVGAIRLAAECLSVPDVLLAFLLSCIFDVQGKDLNPLLFADLCSQNITGISLEKQVTKSEIARVQSRKFAETSRDGERVLNLLGFSGNIGIDMEIHSSEDEEEFHQPSFFPCDVDAEYSNSVTTFFRMMKDNVDRFPDMLLELYSSNSDKQESALNKIPQGLRATWQFTTHCKSTQYVCCNYTTFENVGIACLAQMRREWQRSAPTAPDLVMEHAWAEDKYVPENSHILLSTMFSVLDHLVKDVSPDQEHCTYGARRPPDVSLMVALSQLHQTREHCCTLKRDVRASDVQEQFECVSHALQVHVRNSTGLRHGLLKEFQANLEGCVWARGSVWGFEIPSDIVEYDFQDWLWEEWHWPEDHISDMFYRALAVARFSLGISGKFEDKDQACMSSKVKASFTMTGRLGTPSKKQKKSKSSKEDAVEAKRWASSSNVIKDEITKAKTKRLVQDVLIERPFPLVFALAAGASDAVNGTYSIRQVTTLHRNAKKLFDGTQELYDGLALIFSTRFDTVLPDSKSSVGAVLRSKFPAPDKVGTRIAEWSRLLCWILQLDSQTTTALFQIAHGLVEDKDGDLVLPEVLENFSVRLRLVKTPTSMHGPMRGGEFLRSLCSKRWTIASVEPLALRLGLAPTIIHAVLGAAVGSVDGWISLHKCLSAKPVKDPLPPISYENGLSHAKSAAVTIKKSGNKAAEVFKKSAKGVEPTIAPEEMAGCFFQALEKFARVRHEHRSVTVSDQREWMTLVLHALLPELMRPWSDLALSPDAHILFEELMAFMLHVLSNQNTAAVRVLVEESQLAEAAHLEEKHAVRLQCFMMLCDSSMSKIEDKSITYAVDQLLQPLVDYVMPKPKDLQVAEDTEETETDVPRHHTGVPDDEDFEESDEPLEEQLKTRIRILLQAVLAISTQNYKLLTQIVKVARSIDLQKFIKSNEAVLCFTNPETDALQMRNFVIEPFKHDSEISKLIREKVGMRSLVMLQSLHVLKEVRESHEKNFGSNSSGAVKALAKMVNNLVKRNEEHVANQSNVSGQLELADEKTPGMSSSNVVTGRQGYGELIQGESPSVPATPATPSRGPLPPIPPSRSGPTPSRPESAARPVSQMLANRQEQRSRKEAEKVYNSMMHLFCAFAATDRGEMAKLTVNEQNDFLTTMMDGDRNVPPILPAVAAVASGQLDLLLSHFSEIAKWCCGRKIKEDVALLENLFMLLGMNKEVFVHMVRHQQKFMPELIRRSLRHFKDDEHDIFPDAMDAKYCDNAKSEILEELLDSMMCVLLGYVVGAPPDSFARSMDGLIKILDTFTRDMLTDAKTMNAGKAMLDCADKIALDMANGRTPDFWKGDPPMITVVVDAALDLVAPFLDAEIRKPLQYIIQTLAQLKILQKDPSREGFAKQIPNIVTPLAAAFDVPPIFINGVVALAQADWRGAEDLCMLFCNVDSEKLEQLTALLPSVMGAINFKEVDANKIGAQGVESLANSTGGKFIKSRMQQISNKLSTGNGDSSDLFALTDIDGNGKISMEEFNMCMVRLGYKLLPSRVTEVFSKVKKDLTVQELNEREFKAALEYLQVSVASNTLSMLGKSWPRLLAWLAVLTILLVLVIVFIFLGMAAFTTAGTFSAIVNSCMTIGAGVATFKKGQAQKTDQEEKRKEEQMIEEVQDTIIKDQ